MQCLVAIFKDNDAHVYCDGKTCDGFTPLQLNETVAIATMHMLSLILILLGVQVNFASREEYEQFVEVACILKFYKVRGVAIPEEVQDYFDRNRNKSDVCYVLDEIIKH